MVWCLCSRALAVRLLGGASPRDVVRATLSVAQAVGGEDTAGYARAFVPRPFVFPRDHGPHPDFRTEWWYLTGNLQSETGARFGWQLTIFRSALAPAMPQRASGWATRQVYMAHFALTDVRAGRYHAFERFARGAEELAGAEAAPFRVWLEDWSMRSTDSAFFPLHVQAADSGVAIDLVLTAGKPLVLHGDAGLSRKSDAPGSASYYYSFTRLPAEGTVHTPAGETRVQGASWFDREWSTSSLGPGVAGWDWFALQLNDSTELMVYRLRRSDDSTDPFSAGTFVDARGGTTHLDAAAATITPLATWISPLDGARYPSRWRVRVPGLGLDLEVTPVSADQELNLAVRYWEGAVDVRGTRAGAPIAGRGYVELTGYAGTGLRRGR